MHQFFEVIQRSILFTGISEEELSSILSCFKPVKEHFAKNEYLLRAGDIPSSLGLVLSGNVHIIQDDFQGRSCIRDSITPGQIFAETFVCFSGMKMDVNVIARQDSDILWFDIKRILNTCPTACVFHTRMIRNILSILALSNLHLVEKITHLRHRTIRERLLSYLNSESRKQGRSEFLIPFNRQQLADYLSVERSALSAEISKMQKEGILISKKNYFSIL